MPNALALIKTDANHIAYTWHAMGVPWRQALPLVSLRHISTAVHVACGVWRVEARAQA
jgi:hypothetical protein